MKKTLLSIFSLAFIGSAVAQQTPSPSWTITQNASFSITSAGVRFMDAVDVNTMWLIGYDGAAPGRNYNYWAKTTNGGANFTSGNCFADTSTNVIANLEGIDGCTAWVSTYLKSTQDRGALWKTTNGGTTWTKMSSASMFTVAGTSFVNIVSFVTPSVGIAMGDPIANEFEIYRTNNAGASWTAVPGANIPNPLSGEYGLVNVYEKRGTNSYWFGTNKNRVYRSTDAGLTWSVSAALTSTIGGGAVLGVNDIAFSTANNGVATAYFGPTGNGTLSLFNTTDGGATWTEIPAVDPNFGRNDVAAIPGTTYIASVGAGSGNNIISFSQDNGVTWNSWGGSNIQYLTVDFVNPNTGWAGSFSSNTLATNGGIYKYNGPLLNASPFSMFTVPTCSGACTGSAITMVNSSTGNPAPTYSWSTSGSGAISSPTAANPSITYSAAGIYTITLTATSGTNVSTSTNIVEVAICAGVSENAAGISAMSLYPNPANDAITLEMLNGVNNFNYTLTNVLGNVVATDVVKDHEKVKINLANYAKGIYFLTVESNGEKSTKKIIVE